MAKKEETSVAKQSVQTFLPTDVQKIESLELQLSAIKRIDNDQDLAKAQELLKTSSAMFKAIESERKAFTSRLDLIKTEAMKYEKRVQAADAPVKQITNAYLQKKEAERQEKERQIREEAERKAAEAKKEADQKQALIDFELNTKQAIVDAKGLRDLNTVIKRLEDYTPTEEKFGAGHKEALKLKKELIKLANDQHKALKDKGEKIEIDLEAIHEKAQDVQMQSIQKMQDIDIDAQAKQQSIGSVTGIKKNWVFSLEDIKQVPHEYLIVDHVKVNAVIKAGMRDIPGLKIYQETTRSGR